MNGPLTGFLAGVDRRAWRPVAVFLVLGAITQGIGFAAAVPVVAGLLGDGRITWGWLAVVVVVTAVHAVLHHRSVPMGNGLGADLVVDLTRTIDRRVAGLPNRSLHAEHADRLGTLNGYSVVVLMGLPAHVLRPLVAAVVTPVTVVVVMALVAPWLAVVVAVGSLVVVAVTWVAVRLLVAAGDVDGAYWLDRVVAPDTLSAPRSRVVRLAAGDVLPWRFLELLNCAAVIACVVLVADVGTTPAMAVALVVLSVLMVRPMMEAVLLTGTVLNSHDVLRRVAPLTGAAEVSGAPWPESADVEVTDVATADGDTPVSFRLPANTTTAVLGVPDGRRLALADLLSGDVLPGTGSVRLGGVEVMDLAPADLTARVVRVSVDSPDLIVAEAERLTESVTFTELAAQAELARLRDAVTAGGDLAVADRWRLALLRAAAQEPAVVVVDATAGAAALAESGLAELLSVLRRDRTCLLLWGPGSAPPDCDQVLVVDGGSVELTQGVR